MAIAKSGTLSSNVVASVAVVNNHKNVTVVNRSQSGTIWVRLDGTDPVIGADDNFPVLGAREFVARDYSTVVKLLASSGLAYTVEGA